ncbi:MAG: PDZ domain-containing protein [candidate division Zixibacteria bacterium]|nr:PDZ domain-containing protein [candidate division Zixibacteria bacterium]
MAKRAAIYFSIVFIAIILGMYAGYNLLPDNELSLQSRNQSDSIAQNMDATIIPAQHSDVSERSRRISDERRNAIVKAAEKVSPAVVSLSVTQERVLRRPRSILDEFYSDFWGWYNPPRNYIQKYTTLGSGVIFDPEGYILTNAHVVQDAKTIRVIIPRGDEYDGVVIGMDNTMDVAVVKIEGDNLPHAKLGDSDDLIIGEWAIAFGNPFGYLMEDTEPTVTAGVISALHRDIKRDPNQVQIFRDMIQTDAAINPGNSGGPLVNAVGEVIGINTFIFTSSKGSEGIGFAIPINRAKVIAGDIIEHGEVVKAWVGVYVQTVTPMLAQSLDLSIQKGVIVTAVDDDSPASEAGLRRGDVISKANDELILNDTDWEEFETLSRPGESINISFIRDGKEQSVSLTPKKTQSLLAEAKLDKFGLYVVDITSAVARRLKIRNNDGVVVAGKDPNSVAASWDLQPDDVIRQIGSFNITDSEKYFDLIDRIDKGDRFTLVIERDGLLFYHTVRF